jgi:gluconokinase
MQALGLVPSIDVAADLVQVRGTVRPVAGPAATYAALQPVFADLYHALVPTYSALRRLGPGLPLELPPAG